MARLPKFNSEAEEAEFWATHELTEFEADLEPADVRAMRPDQVVAVRLSKADVNALRRLAERKGIGYTTLIRVWIKEKLQKERV